MGSYMFFQMYGDIGFMIRTLCKLYNKTGFPQWLENLENENGHGKDMEHDKTA